MGWIKTTAKNKVFWKNDKIGRWVGVQKGKTGYRAYTIKNGFITHGDFLKKPQALSQAKKFRKYS